MASPYMTATVRRTSAGGSAPFGIGLEFDTRPVAVHLFNDRIRMYIRCGSSRTTIDCVRDSPLQLAASECWRHTSVYHGCDSSPASVAVAPRGVDAWVALADQVFADWSRRGSAFHFARGFSRRDLSECVTLMRHLSYPVREDEWPEAKNGLDRLRTAHPAFESAPADKSVSSHISFRFGRHRYYIRHGANTFETGLIECFKQQGRTDNFWWLCAEYADAIEGGDAPIPKRVESVVPDLLAVLRSGIKPLPWEFGL